jgi:dethiobiotin synthetase
LRGLFVTGTDTGVGKTVLSGAIVAALRARGLEIKPLKPVMTGLDEPGPADHELLSVAGGCAAQEVALISYGPPVSPHLAAELAGQPISCAELKSAVEAAAAHADAVVVEGVGGLLVPLSDDCDVRALAFALGLPLVVAARPGLGTINHTLLTLEAARAAGLTVAAVVLTPWPAEPDVVALSNRDTIARLGQVAVETLPVVESAEPGSLAQAGGHLPLERWLSLT